jgi:hypothetical protein
MASKKLHPLRAEICNRRKQSSPAADTLSTDHEARQFGVMAAGREGAGRFIVHADEKLTAFLEMESMIRAIASIPTHRCPGAAV